MVRKNFIFILMLFLVFANFIFAEENNVVSAKISGSQIEVTFKIPEGLHQSLQKEYFYLEADSIPGIVFEPTVYPAGKKEHDLINYYGSVTLTKKFKVDKNVDPNLNSLKIYAGYQFCYDSGSCLFPEEVELDIPIDLTKIEKPESTAGKEQTVADEQTEQSPATSATALNIIKFLIMAFLGGLILNVMPCVLPVLSIKAMSLVKQSQQDKKQILRSSMAYTFGILVSFIILAAIIIILKMSGEMVGWGFQFQSAGFVTGLLIVIFVFALSLFDVFIINAPGMQVATKASSKGGLTGSFVSGIFAVLLATPCTAPLLGAALGFAFSQPPLIILAIFILIGLGLAFPFILLGFWPKAIRIIPKPGEWMNIFKEVMGFLLFLTALYLLRTLYFLIGGKNLINVLLYLIILSFATWIYGRFARPEFSRKKQWIAIIVALIVAVGGGFLTLKYDNKHSQQTVSEENANIHEGWQKFSPELVEKYRAEGKPVFIDFSAEWCLTCKTNENTVLFTKDIQKEFRKRGVQLLAGDNTKKDKIIGEWLRRFGRAGVPLYILYLPGEEKPIVLPELITKDMVLNALKKLDK